MLYILPGMGANSKMYTSFYEWTTLSKVKFLDWPKWEGEKSIEELAVKLIEVHSICESDTIAGSSLGGMVSLEIAKQVNARKAILIGSAANSKEVNSLLLSLAPIAPLTPISLIQLLCGKYRSELLKMFTESDANFIKCMCPAIRDWRGAEDYQRIDRIHGNRDMVINCPKNAHIIKGGGHLIAMTHPQECVQLLKTVIEL